jgi:hypothetical protein
LSLREIFSILTLFVGLSTHLVADEWPSPQIGEVFSADRRYFVRITPAESLGETWGFKGAKIGKHAQAAFFREQPDKGYRLERTIEMPNPVAPVEVFVSNNRDWSRWTIGTMKAMAQFSCCITGMARW